MTKSTPTQYELRFQSLFGAGPGYVFPCDPKGRVDLNQLSDRARNNYLFARAVVGRELAVPALRLTGYAEEGLMGRRSQNCFRAMNDFRFADSPAGSAAGEI